MADEAGSTDKRRDVAPASSTVGAADDDDRSPGRWREDVSGQPVVPTEVDVDAVVRVIRREGLESGPKQRVFERLVTLGGSESIRPAGVKPTGGKLAKSERVSGDLGLTLERVTEAGADFQSLQEIVFADRVRIVDEEQTVDEEETIDEDEELRKEIERDRLEAVAAAKAAEEAAEEEAAREPLYKPKLPVYQNDLQFVQDLAMAEPKMVAMAVREWLK